jgi:hypothetical protein
MTQVNQCDCDGSQVCQDSDLRWPRLEHHLNLDGLFSEHRGQLHETQNYRVFILNVGFVIKLACFDSVNLKLCSIYRMILK